MALASHHYLRAGYLLLIPFLSLGACISGEEPIPNLGYQGTGNGPMVLFDPLEHPNPRVPFPNDLIAVMDPASPTGRRINVRTDAPTGFERAMRREMNRLDGFGTFASISVPFDGPLDLDTLSPQNIRLINIDPHSERYGEEIPLDLPAERSSTLYPLEITPWHFPPHTPYATARQVLFDPSYGDVGTPGFVDFYERETNTLILRMVRPMDQQTEYIVVLTKDLKGLNGEPVRSPFATTVHMNQVQGYRRALPLLQDKGIPEQAVAFAWTFTTQTITRDLEVIADGLHGQGPMGSLRDRYPPAFTEIANMETCLDRYFCFNNPDGNNPCRDNLWIVQAEFLDFFIQLLLTQAPELIRVFGVLLMEVDLGQDTRLELPLDAVDYFVFGRFRSIGFQEDESEQFRMDYRTGEAWTKEIEVPFFIAIPKPSPGHTPPFPVVIHSHGTPSFRWEAIVTANTWARHGYASACLDAPRHSPIVSIPDVQILMKSIVHTLEQGLCKDSTNPQCQAAWDTLIQAALDGVGGPVLQGLTCFLFGRCSGEGGGSFEDALDGLLKSGFFAQLLVEGRAKDLDGDGNTDHGALFTADLFKCRDRVRQTVVDHMQFVQVLKALSQEKVPSAVNDPEQAAYEEIVPNLLAGDFNADGVLDLGGEYAYGEGPDGIPSGIAGEQRYFRDGISYGGITDSILMAIEPDVRTAAFSVPGGGLTDILMRSDLRAVMDRVFHEVLGPVVVGEPVEGTPGMVRLFFIKRGKKDIVETIGIKESLMTSTLPVPIGEIDLPEGGSVQIANQDNGEYATITPLVCEEGSALQGLWGCFSKGIPADTGDRILIAAIDDHGRTVDRIETMAPTQGLGLDRNSSDFRSFANLGQIALDPADPINYAPHWFMDPLDTPGLATRPAKNILVTAVPGDMFVPINTQIAVARAGGLLGSESNQCDGWPRDLAECGSDWKGISRDCDCINLYWKAKGVMTGFYPRFDVDGLSPECTQFHGAPLIDNRRGGAGFSYVRFPFSDVWVSYGYPQPVNRGMHWYLAFSDSRLPLNWAAYSQNQMAEFFESEGYSALPQGEYPVPDCPCPVSPEGCRFLR